MSENSAITSLRGEWEFLSNFYPSPITLDGITYPSVEHAFAAAKTSDQGTKERISAAPTPAAAKRIGRAVTLVPGWDANRLDVMRLLLEAKFADEELAAKLLASGERRIIEGNTWGDRYWGVCDGHGSNHLGQLLMELRSRLRYGNPRHAEQGTLL